MRPRSMRFFRFFLLRLDSKLCSDGVPFDLGVHVVFFWLAKDLLDLVVIFSFVKVFCANVCGQLFPLYGSSRCLYGPGLVHV